MDHAAGYFDGAVPTRRSVVVRVDGDALAVRAGDDGRPIARWPCRDVRLVDTSSEGSDIRLRRRGGEDDRLVIDGAEVPGWLAEACPDLRRSDGGDGRFWRRIGAWTVVACGAVAVLVWVVIPALAGQIVALIPVSVEQRFGERILDRALETLTLLDRGDTGEPRRCTSAEGQRTIDALAATLVAGLDPPPPVTVTVLRTKMVNAVALPGGQIVVFQGLLEFAETGDEFAGILAHEIAHVHRRHSLHFVIQEAATNALIGIVVGDVFGGGIAAGLARVLVTTQYTRDMEREADAIGTELMNRAGFDANALASALERLGRRHGEAGDVFAYVSTHPATAERVAAVRERAAGGRAALTDGEWSAIKTMCDGS